MNIFSRMSIQEVFISMGCLVTFIWILFLIILCFAVIGVVNLFLNGVL